MNETATSVMMKDRSEEIEKLRVENEIRRFTEAWAPDDKNGTAQFSAELLSIVRLIYMDMQRPITQTLAGIMAMQPSQTIFYNPDTK